MLNTDTRPLLLLASGGMDSTFLLTQAPAGSCALFIRFGQENEGRERQALTRLTPRFPGVEFAELNVSLPFALIKKPSLKDPVIPARNVLLLTLGARVAEARGLRRMQIGCCADDASEFPDCRGEFVDAFNEVLKAAGLWVRVEAPLLWVRKMAVAARLRALGLLDITWSCYHPLANDRPCGQCLACKVRNAAHLESLDLAGAERVNPSPDRGAETPPVGSRVGK